MKIDFTQFGDIITLAKHQREQLIEAVQKDLSTTSQSLNSGIEEWKVERLRLLGKLNSTLDNFQRVGSKGEIICASI